MQYHINIPEIMGGNTTEQQKEGRIYLKSGDGKEHTERKMNTRQNVLFGTPLQHHTE
jgi:hypothetical protein